MTDTFYLSPSTLRANSDARFVVALCHDGTDYCVRGWDPEQGDDEHDETLTLEAARAMAAACAAEQGNRWFDFSGTTDPRDSSIDTSGEPLPYVVGRDCHAFHVLVVPDSEVMPQGKGVWSYRKAQAAAGKVTLWCSYVDEYDDGLYALPYSVTHYRQPDAERKLRSLVRNAAARLAAEQGVVDGTVWVWKVGPPHWSETQGMARVGYWPVDVTHRPQCFAKVHLGATLERHEQRVAMLVREAIELDSDDDWRDEQRRMAGMAHGSRGLADFDGLELDGDRR